MRSGITLLLIATFSLVSFQQPDSVKVRKLTPEQIAFAKRIDRALNTIEETSIGIGNLTAQNKDLFQRAKELRIINDSLVRDRNAQTEEFTRLLAKTYALAERSEKQMKEDRKAWSEYIVMSKAFMNFFQNASFWVFIPYCIVSVIAFLTILFYKMEIWRIKALIKEDV